MGPAIDLVTEQTHSAPKKTSIHSSEKWLTMEMRGAAALAQKAQQVQWTQQREPWQRPRPLAS